MRIDQTTHNLQKLLGTLQAMQDEDERRKAALPVTDSNEREYLRGRADGLVTAKVLLLAAVPWALLEEAQTLREVFAEEEDE